MAKGKRPSSRKQVSPETIAKAQYAKRHGFISKQAKTTGGRISRAVEKKLQLLDNVQALPRYENNPATNRPKISAAPKRTGIAVTSRRAAQLKDQGFIVIGNRAVVPAKDKRYVEAVGGVGQYNAGGVKIPRSELLRETVPEGTQEVLVLNSIGIRNFRDLMTSLAEDKMNGVYKKTDEVWAFTYYGNHVLDSRTFRTDAELFQYLLHYKSMWEHLDSESDDDQFANFELIRLNRNDNLGSTPASVRKANKAKYGGSSRIEQIRARSKQLTQEQLTQNANRLAAQERKASQKYREAVRARLGDTVYKEQEAIKRRARARNSRIIK